MGNAPWSLICQVFAFVLLAIGAFAWPPVIDTNYWRLKFVSAGLMFLVLAQLVRAG